MSRIKQIEKQMQDANKITSTFAGLIYSTIEALGEFGASIPLLEIIVTIFAYYRSGLGELFGLEVLAGLVFAQIAALFLTAHYKNTAMHELGEYAIFASVMVGAMNTGIAIFLALTLSHNDATALPSWVVYFPAISSALAVLFIYTAKLYTMERVASRLKFRTEANAELREIERIANAHHKSAKNLDEMQNTQLTLQVETMNELAHDPLIKNAYKLIMRDQALQNVLKVFEVNHSTKLARLLKEQIVKANEDAVGGEANVDTLRYPVRTNGLNYIDLAEGQDPNV